MAIIRHFGGPLSAARDLDGEVHRRWRQSLQGMLYRPPPWPEAVCIEFRRKIDDAIRAEHGGTLPWQRNIERGASIIFAMHAQLLDRIDDIVSSGCCRSAGGTAAPHGEAGARPRRRKSPSAC